MEATLDTQTPATETAAPASWMGSLPEEVRSTIPQEYTKDPNVTKYTNVAEMVKGHVNLAKLVGAKGVILPTEKSSPEEINEFYGKLGRPAKPEEYKFAKLDVHKSLNNVAEFDKDFANIAHKNGLTPSQADGVRKEFLDTFSSKMSMREKTSEEARANAETALRSKWQGDFDKNMKTANMMVDKFGGKDVLPDWGNNPAAIEFLANIGKSFSEDSIGGKGMGTESTPESAQKVIETLVKDKNSDYYSNDDNKRAPAVKKVMEAYKKIHGGA